MQVWEALRSERRRDFALGSVIGGGVVMTILAFWITWFLRDANAVYIFNIAIGALINIAAVALVGSLLVVILPAFSLDQRN